MSKLPINAYFPLLAKTTETKNMWARDDPAILVLLSACLIGPSSRRSAPSRSMLTVHVVSAVAWSFVHSYPPPMILKYAFLMIFRDFLAVGALIATCLWYAFPSICLSRSSFTPRIYSLGSCPTSSSFSPQPTTQRKKFPRSSGRTHLMCIRTHSSHFTSRYTWPSCSWHRLSQRITGCAYGWAIHCTSRREYDPVNRPSSMLMRYTASPE